MNKKQLALSVAETILLSALEIGEISLQAFFPPKYARKYGYASLIPRKQLVNECWRLKKRGLIQKHGTIYRLTQKGEREAFFANLDGVVDGYKPKPEKWDGKWRMIFFDIPEKKRRYRDELRRMLKTIGFKEFQQSIWAYPYHVPEFLKEILWTEQIKHYTRLITTEHIEYDNDLRRKFHLPQSTTAVSK